jgi:hypothetical protein
VKNNTGPYDQEFGVMLAKVMPRNCVHKCVGDGTGE